MVLRVLIIEDNPADAELIERLLKKAFPQLEAAVVTNGSDLSKKIKDFRPDIFLSDNSLPRFSAAEALTLVKFQAPHIPFILVTGTVSEEFAAEMIKSGADDYILKDRMARLPAAIEAALLKRSATREKEEFFFLLKQSQENLQTIFNNTTEGFVLLDRQFRVKMFNNQVSHLLSLYIQKQIIDGQLILELVESSHRDFFRSVLARVKNGEFVEYERPVPNPLGNDAWINFSFNPVVHENLVAGICITVRDISVSKRAEMLLKRSLSENSALAKRVSAILNTLPANVALLDEEGFILDVNESWKKFAVNNGFMGEEYAIGENYLVITENAGIADSSSGGTLIAEGIKAVLTRNCQEFITEYACDSENVRRWYRMIVTPLSGQAYQGAVVMHIDISEIKKLEQERLQNKINEQKRMGRAILKAQEKERNAIGIELHDNVNQILVGTNLLLSHIRSNPLESTELLSHAMSNLQHAIRENRKVAHEFVAPDLETLSLLEQLHLLFEKMLQPLGIDVAFIATGLDEDRLDSDRKFNIYRVAQEQCTNIVKYAAANTVKVALSTSENMFTMKIADDGKGMHTEQKGEGIGLRNIKHRVSLFNGVTDIATAPGKGFTLDIRLPLDE